jgi:protein-S-isoprenylcysteine O-methyltransferase Ste14
MIWKLLLQTALWYLLMAGLLFGAGGTLAWFGAWAFLVEMLLLGLPAAFWFLYRDPGLLAERLKPPVQQGQSIADRWLIGAFLILWCAWLAAMGLEIRGLGVTDAVWAEAAGALLIAASFGIVIWTFTANSYAAPVVKIQAERRHRVATTGPYRFVRHPMYGGVLPLLVGIPLLLGAYWGLAWVPILEGLLAVRSVLEERVLRANLDGYSEYADRVRFRLIPTIW